ncbi:MAG TPA: hypothetical protein VK144_08910 [Bacillota bacterium]|nr:hypothetical protein [Bacillota bacterium]
MTETEDTHQKGNDRRSNVTQTEERTTKRERWTIQRAPNGSTNIKKGTIDDPTRPKWKHAHQDGNDRRSNAPQTEERTTKGNDRQSNVTETEEEQQKGTIDPPT